MSGLREALRFAAEREREAEVFYKEWAERAEEPSARVLFRELGAAEHVHWETLLHIEPADVLGRSRGRAAEPSLADRLLRVASPARPTLGGALAVALRRKDVARRLYERLAELGGEASALFRSLAREEEAHAARLREILANLPADD